MPFRKINRIVRKGARLASHNVRKASHGLRHHGKHRIKRAVGAVPQKSKPAGKTVRRFEARPANPLKEKLDDCDWQIHKKMELIKILTGQGESEINNFGSNMQRWKTVLSKPGAKVGRKEIDAMIQGHNKRKKNIDTKLKEANSSLVLLLEERSEIEKELKKH